jgi:catechol 2,3-dioxygenase-like lactoylglutathione lyase family enzyme
MNINGIAHIALNVSDLKTSKIFYDIILSFLGMTLIHSSKKSFYYVGGKTGILIQQVKINKMKNQGFSQGNLGLHHFCFRMRSKEDIKKFYSLLIKIKANIIRGPIDGNWVKGYYYIVFEDPDGIRLEVNYVPNKGIFEKNAKFNPSGDY